jgi:hypothetical protein
VNYLYYGLITLILVSIFIAEVIKYRFRNKFLYAKNQKEMLVKTSLVVGLLYLLSGISFFIMGYVSILESGLPIFPDESMPQTEVDVYNITWFIVGPICLLIAPAAGVYSVIRIAKLLQLSDNKSN